VTKALSRRTGRRPWYYARLVAGQLRVSVLAALQYRLGFWTEGVLGVVWSALGMAPLLVAVANLDTVTGWGPWELVVLTGCFTTLSGLFGAMLQPALLASMNGIRDGSLDYVLLRPADALVLCLIAGFAPWRFVEAIGGVAMIVVGLMRIGRVPTPADLAMALAIGAAGLAALYAFGILVLCTAFRAIRMQNLMFLLEALLDFGRWPASVFRGFLRVVFTFVVPLAVMTTYPAEALIGRLAPRTVAVALATAAVLLALARAVWLRSLRGYTSASS
jgi:ABC-2 type transport system permease protein